MHFLASCTYRTKMHGIKIKTKNGLEIYKYILLKEYSFNFKDNKLLILKKAAYF
jgi:hypothetical protein